MGAVLIILTQNHFLLHHLVSDDEGRAMTCHSHEFSQ